MFKRPVNPEFERKFDVQNSYFGVGYVFRISFFKLLNNLDIKCKKFYNKLQRSCIGTCLENKN